MITGILREDVPAAWPKIAPHFVTFARLSDGEETVDDLIDGVMAGKRQVWVAIRGEEHLATALTEIRKNGMAWIVYVAGRDRDVWRDAMVGTVAAWATEKGASKLMIAARLGWVPELDGFRKRRVVMEMGLGQ